MPFSLPVRAPPRLPLLNGLPSSLSCLLNFSGLLGPEETSGLLDFRNGIDGGDNILSSCKKKKKAEMLELKAILNLKYRQPPFT